jgi:predicted AAA+ superfamily ATPase
VVSGSAAAALRLKSHESGAGRFTDFLLPPLTFAEFLRFTDRLLDSREEQLFTDEAVASLNASFLDYLNYGGFPEAVLDDAVRRSMDRYIANDIIDKVLLRDLPSLYGIGDTAELNRLFTMIAYNTGNEVNIEELSKASGVAKNTLRKYLEYLEAAFLIQRLYRIDQNARHFKRATHFKIYLTNPCLRSALFGSVSEGDDAMGRMVETAFVSQLVHSAAIDRLYYARWAKGEVDFVLLSPGTLKPQMAIEVKWSDRAAANPDSELASLLFFAAANELQLGLALTRTTSQLISRGDLRIALIPAAQGCIFGAQALVDKILARGLHPRSLSRLAEEFRGWEM